MAVTSTGNFLGDTYDAAAVFVFFRERPRLFFGGGFIGEDRWRAALCVGRHSSPWFEFSFTTEADVVAVE